MAGINYTTVEKFIIKACCTQPLHVGGSLGAKNEVLLHPVSGKPFLQASGIAGALRSASVKVNGGEITEALFGSDRFGDNANSADGASRIRIEDGILKNVKLEYRPRVSIDPESGTANATDKDGKKFGHKFEMESVAAGAGLAFCIYLFGPEYLEELKKVFALLKNEKLQFGGQKSNGSGFIKAEAVLHRSFDLKTPAGRRDWAAEDSLSENKYEDIINKLPSASGGIMAYTVLVEAETEGDMLVKGLAVNGFGENAPDAENMRNAKGEYIVPGSSLKGAVRSRMEYIAAYLKKEFLIESCFGKVGRKNDTGAAGNIIVKDAVIGEIAKNEKAALRHHIHIDRFTGGVIHGGLFSDKNAFGKLNLTMLVADRGNADASLGLLLLALRDLSAGIFNLGSGYSTGKGFVKVKTITVTDEKTGAKSVFRPQEKSLADGSGLFKKALSAVKEAEVC